MNDRTGDIINVGAAAGAFVSPLWLPTLQDISSVTADLAAPVGFAFLVIRFWDYLRKRRNV